jgi:plastocyanin
VILLRTSRTAPRPVLAFVVGLASLAAPAVATPADAPPRGVAILDYRFEPATVTIRPGRTVVWTNRGRAVHTVTSDDGTTMRSGVVRPRGTFEAVFARPGRYAYHCLVHGQMRATVIVLRADGSAPPAAPAEAAALTPPPLSGGPDDAGIAAIVVGGGALATALLFGAAYRRRSYD